MERKNTVPAAATSSESSAGGGNDFKKTLEAMLARGRAPTMPAKKPEPESTQKYKIALFDDVPEEQKMEQLSSDVASGFLEMPKIAQQRKASTKYQVEKHNFDDF